MDMQAYKEEILLKLTGCVLESELDDPTLEKIINSAFREIQRYIDTTKLATIKYEQCIDLSDCSVSSVSRVFRTKGYGAGGNADNSQVDPLYFAQYQMLGGVNGMFNFENYAYNYAAWNTASQIRNTMSTDLIFRFDKSTSKLYINAAYDKPQYITIEYVPRYNDVSEITSDYWIDILVRLSTALAKQIVGRIRSRFTQTNALWTQDGETLLAEGNEELNNLRDFLRDNSQLVFPID